MRLYLRSQAREVFSARHQIGCYNTRNMNANSGRSRARRAIEPTGVEFRRSALKEHKLPIGHMAADGTYRIVKLLPSDGDDYQYRIKSASEAFERVAKESQLDRFR